MSGERIIGPLYDWARNALHNSPGEAWDGLATCIAPSAGRQDTGYEPEDQPDAEEINAIFKQILGMIKHLADVQPQNWRHLTATGTGVHWDGANGCANAGGLQAFGYEGFCSWNPASVASVVMFPDGKQTACADTNIAHPLRLFHPQIGLWLAIGGGASSPYKSEFSGQGGASWSYGDDLAADKTAELGCHAYCYDTSIGSFVVLGKSEADDTPWVSVYDHAGNKITEIQLSASHTDSLTDISSNGSAVFVCGNDTYWLSDNGDGAALSFAEYTGSASPWGANSVANVDYCPDLGWVAVWWPSLSAGIMRFAVSADGITWGATTEVTFPEATLVPGVQSAFRPFFRVKNKVWYVLLYSNDSSYQDVLAYSTNAGMSWSYRSLHAASTPTVGLNLAKISDAIAVGGGLGIDVSLRVGPVEFGMP